GAARLGEAGRDRALAEVLRHEQDGKPGHEPGPRQVDRVPGRLDLRGHIAGELDAAVHLAPNVVEVRVPALNVTTAHRVARRIRVADPRLVREPRDVDREAAAAVLPASTPHRDE